MAGLDPGALIRAALHDETNSKLVAALADFEQDGCPGVPTWVIDGERFWGKDRIDWLVERLRSIRDKD